MLSYWYTIPLLLAHNRAGVIWSDVLLMDEVLPEAAISDFCLEVLFMIST